MNQNEPSSTNLAIDIAGFKVAVEFMGNELKELKNDFRDFKQNYVPISQHLELKEFVNTLSAKVEAHKSWIDTATGRVLGISTAVGVVFGVISFYLANFIKN